MDNNNGRGIFYGVIGVATLVVAMIGATFAYFSASISTDGDPITLNSTTIDLNLTQNTKGIKFNLIPVDETLPGFATGGYIGNKDSEESGDFNCIDDDGNEFCSVYEVTVTNPSKTTAQTIYARIDVGTNDFPANAKTDGKDTCEYLDKTGEDMYCEKSNIAFAIFKGTANDVNTKSANFWNVTSSVADNWYSSSGGTLENALGVSKSTTADANTTAGNVAGTPVLGKLGDMVVARTAVPTGKTNNSFMLDSLSQTLKPEGSATYTIVMWIHENGEDQELSEGKTFAAGITFSTSLKGSGVTAVLATTQVNNG